MNRATIALKQEIQKTVVALQTLRDGMRMNLHLAGLDARDEWNKLEPHIVEIEQIAEDVTDATHARLEDVVRRVKAFREAHGQGRPRSQ